MARTYNQVQALVDSLKAAIAEGDVSLGQLIDLRDSAEVGVDSESERLNNQDRSEWWAPQNPSASWLECFGPSRVLLD